MRTGTERYHVPAHGPDDEAVRIGLAWLAESTKRLEQGTLYVPGLDNLRSLERVIGNVSMISKSRVFILNGARVQIATTRTGRVEGAVLALWTDDEILRTIEDRFMPPAICAIPWSKEGIDRWIAAFEPVDLRTGQRTRGKTVSNPVVVEALNSLTTSVNLGTGLAHPSDHDAAVWTFRALREANEEFDPEEVRSWAAAHGWQIKAADELADIAQRVIDGRRIKTYMRPWKSDIVDYWRKRSREASPL